MDQAVGDGQMKRAPCAARQPPCDGGLAAHRTWVSVGIWWTCCPLHTDLADCGTGRRTFQPWLQPSTAPSPTLHEALSVTAQRGASCQQQYCNPAHVFVFPKDGRAQRPPRVAANTAGARGFK